ncbi:hypothetical protein [Solibacillus sp. FSL K6-4121]|uniref:hypothetical protein n=1 Tax=Solibacillus sp. FSL K6-4121 TaxID=2921505 RepID=UPI0030F7A4D7
MHFAYSEVEITPSKPVQLGGFAHRIGYVNEVHQPLYLRLIAVGNVWLFTADLLWWDDQLILKWKDKLALKGVTALFHASHSHCTPNTHTELSNILGEIDLDYINFLEACILECTQTLNNFTCNNVQISDNIVDVGSYRRRKVGNIIKMAPNEEQKINKKVTSIILSEGDEAKILFVHFACHPTVSDMNKISSEYCGTVISELKKTYQIPIIFLQGFCGDIRPNLITQGEYYRGSKDDIERIGYQIVQAVKESKKVLSERLYLKPLVKTDEINFELFETQVAPISCSRFEKSELPFRSSLLSISPQCSFIFANAEMSNFYQDHLNKVYGVGYTDGMIGYVATQKQIKNGGYEGKEFIKAFGNRGTFDPSIEMKIHQMWKGWLK